MGAVTGFSYVPLQVATFLGFVFAALSLLAIPIVAYMRLFLEEEPLLGQATTLIVLLLVSGVQLISGQNGPPKGALAELRDAGRLIDLSDRLDKLAGPFMDTAAIMQACDLVMTCDTVYAHLAGALGCETWLPLHQAADWRWLLEREDTPWYPTMRLFRQRKLDDWTDVFPRIRDALVERLAKGGRAEMK